MATTLENCSRPPVRASLALVLAGGVTAGFSVPAVADPAHGAVVPVYSVARGALATDDDDPGATESWLAPESDVERWPATAELDFGEARDWSQRWSDEEQEAPVTQTREAVEEAAKIKAAKANAVKLKAAKLKAAKAKAAKAAHAGSTDKAQGAALSGAAGTPRIASGLSGIAYRWGGTTTRGFDCSGFTRHVYRQAGISLPRTAAAQQRATRRVSDPVPGDLVFFGSPAHHVGIYAGNGRMYDSPRRGKTTGLHKIWSSKATYGRVR